MKFYKYPDIENHYRKKIINDNLKYNPHMQNEIYIAQEKIDGANFQIAIDTRTSEIKYGKRSSYLSEKSNFFDYQTVIKSEMIDDFIQSFINVINLNYITKEQYDKYIDLSFNNCNKLDEFYVYYLKHKPIQVILYGELYGKGIQKRINYGDKKYIKFYDIRFIMEDESSVFLPVYLFYHLFHELEFNELASPMISKFKNLNDALEMDVENIKTHCFELSNIGEDFVEGVVIKPLHNSNTRFYIKKKTKRFSEDNHNKKNKKELTNEEKQALNLRESFEEYINENRINSAISKFGPVEKPQYSEFIKFVINDALNDFIKDYENEYNKLNKKEQRLITKGAGKIIVRYI